MRSGKSNALGKLTVSISLKITEATNDELQLLAADAGLTPAEFVRRLIELRVHGDAHILRLEAERNAVVAGKISDGQQ